jgi:type III secretion system low calcium response chaperone LcrH/SycD
MAEEEGNVQAQQLQVRLRNLVDQWAQGRVSLKQIVGLSEEELYAIASQGYYLFLQGKSEPARVLFEGLVAIDPRNAYYYRALGAIYWRLKEPQKAVRQFTYAIRVAPHEVSSYVNRAEVYVALQQFQLATNDLQFALRHAGARDAALVKKARAMMRMIS